MGREKGGREEGRIQMDVHRERLVKCYFERRFVAFVHFASSSRYIHTEEMCHRHLFQRISVFQRRRRGWGERRGHWPFRWTYPLSLPPSLSLSLSISIRAFRVDFHLAACISPRCNFSRKGRLSSSRAFSLSPSLSLPLSLPPSFQRVRFSSDAPTRSYRST